MRNSELMRSRANVSALDLGRMESDLQAAVGGISPAGKIIIKEKGEKAAIHIPAASAALFFFFFPGR